MSTIRDTVKNRNELARAAEPGRALMSAVADGKLSMSGVLAAVGIDPKNPVHQAALLVAEKYRLDPLMKHVIVIQGKGVYITRDGYLHVAHDSGQFDGIEVVDQWETDTHWMAKVTVYRKDMSRGFTYVGRYSKTEGGNKKYGPEMAVTRAEVMSLRRAFDVSGLPARDEQYEAEDDTVTIAATVVAPPAGMDTETGEVLEAEVLSSEAS